MQYEYGESGKMTRAQDASGNVWIWEYDHNGNITHHSGPGNEFWKEYDEFGREVLYKCGENVVKTSYGADGVAQCTTTH